MSRDDADIDLSEKEDDSYTVPEVREGPMTRSKSKQLRRRFNLAVQDIVNSLEVGEANRSKTNTCEDELSEAFTQLSLGKTPGIDSSFAGEKIPRSQENALEIQEACETSFDSNEEPASQEQAQGIKDVGELPESNQDMEEKLHEDYYIKDPVRQQVVRGVDQGVSNQSHTRPGKLYSIFNILAGSSSVNNT